ncbi:citrate/2-methylcitrate synthase [Serpentinicella alkaliphila]|uniref:Citrate synthase n=1 Tax=Serpentinicella alkaliphila TaxID=1734049 RepID=A0A4R2TJV1_9FIRM|nr:citrate/2-methylcitrate synthase [Serpentinicella alkaliphila]QUH24664.1 citrate/2-methylcitrate synthase [Serpentinicella alkaliphila]TCQ03076.1 citrate synthase [Serpentinicella alkaliphila]
MVDLQKFIDEQYSIVEINNTIAPELHRRYNTKRGLRNEDGTGVLIGLTEIGEVHAYIMVDGEKIPQQGKLFYRGYEVSELVKGYKQEKRFGFEEVAYLLIFGELPNESKLKTFNEILGQYRTLPHGFTEDMILKAPSSDIMNKLARSVLTCYSYDNNPDDIEITNVLRQSIELTSRFPIMAAYGYQAKAHFYDNKSLYIHLPQEHLSTAENFLYMIRPDNQYTELEAEILDLNLIIHAEHGGGNNSAFTTHVVSSTDTDTYSAIAAAVGALKGPKHGGANIKVMNMMDDIKRNVKDWSNGRLLEDYLVKIVKKEAYDKSGLIYGIGHAVYTLSDPRSVLLKEKATELAKEKGMEEELNLYFDIEKLAPNILAEVRGITDVRTANVDFYSGFVYDMLNIPRELYTPLFAIARIPGWCAHRIEEIVSGGKIIRPAYKNVAAKQRYIPLNER